VPQPARLRIELRGSLQLTLLLVFAHAFTAAIVAVLPLPLWARIALLGALAVSFATSAMRHAWSASPRACAALEVHRDGGAQWWLRSGKTQTGRVLGASFVSPLLTVVALRRDDNGRRESIVLLPDSAEAEALCALRVWLRFKVEVE